MTNTVKVSEVAQQVRGVTYDKLEASTTQGPGMLPILRANNITEHGLIFQDLVYVPVSRINEKQRIRKGDIVIAASSGSLEVVGKAALVETEFDGGFGAFCKVLRPNAKVDSNYFAHFFKTSSYRRRISALAAGANINNLRNEHLDDLVIPLPSLDEQRRIAAILDKADALRAIRRAALAKLDSLTQSIFLDMFGDPATNPKGWPTSSLDDLTSPQKSGLKRGPFGGALKKEIFVESGFQVYEQQHAIYKQYDPGRYFITASKYQEMKGFTLRPGDFIVSCSGTVGRIYRIPEGAPEGVINQALLRITLDTGIINPIYFESHFENDHFQDKLLGNSRGTGISNFPPMEQIRSIALMVPPLKLQAQFAQKLEALDALKERGMESQLKFNALFFSLQQRAFNGELTNRKDAAA